TGKQRTIGQMLVDQFMDVMIIILIVAAIVSAALGEVTDAAVILGIVILNAVIGVVQENRATRSLQALRSLSAPNAKVIRGGVENVIPARDIVPGDVVVLETGDVVPADLRLITSLNLKIQEAALTGESVPVEKNADAVLKEDDVLGDRINLAFSSSMVTYGRGTGVCVATGMNTQVGRIAEMIQETGTHETPLQKRLEAMGKALGIGALAICLIIFITGIIYQKDWFEMLLTSISLAVAAIPEGLPAISTIVLAIGVQRMVKRHAIVRTLPAVETLGSATVICSDKTGTLTQNRMTVKRTFFNRSLQDIEALPVDDEAAGRMVSAAVLCNDARARIEEDGTITLLGDPTETALIDMGIMFDYGKEKLEKELPRVAEVPFDSTRKLMSTVHALPQGGYRVYTKGGLDELLVCCVNAYADGGARPLAAVKDEIASANHEMAAHALRVLALAYKDIERLPEQMEQVESGLTFLGMVGMIDPPRLEAKKAVATCREAGIKPVMITGDHQLTASAIAGELGILGEGDKALSGRELELISDEELAKNVQDYAVYARVSPEHKVRIVDAWKKQGAVVAMTGDGVNDAPALKRADIGAAMGIVGTDVAKEAADIVLTDDNFATVVAAVEEGRRIFDNILKAIQFLLSCNVGEIITLFVATLLNWEEPLLPIHILWINLISDSLPALALGMDPAEGDIMKRPPYPSSGRIFSGGMLWRIGYQGVMVGALTLNAFVIGSGVSHETGQTMAFLVLAFSQLVHVFNVRSKEKSAFHSPFSNGKLWGAIAVSAALIVVVVAIPALAAIFKLTALSGTLWAAVILLSLAPLAIVELFKLFKVNTLKDE
ncbi:MAG: calcium-translocating P-type ATPase, PMCA-type, partial [Bacillota bacterium]